MVSRTPGGFEPSPAMIHSILGRQLRDIGVDPTGDDAPDWLPGLLDRIGAYYEELETIRNRLEDELRNAYVETQRLEDTIHDLRSDVSAQSNEHYLDLFERIPIPTWEEDFEAVHAWLAELRSMGVKDLAAYLADNPDELRRGVSLIQVTNVNPAAAELVGAPDEVALIGPLARDTVDDDSAPAFLAQFEAIWHSQDSVRTNLKGTRFDGRKFDGIIEWRVLKSGRRYDYSRVLVTIVDITDQKAVERKAVASLRSHEEMIASVTHELRTPLTSVLGFAELLKAMDQGDYEEEREGLLSIISNQAADLSDLVEDLLTSARSELGELNVAKVPVNVHAQIAQVLEGAPSHWPEFGLPVRPDEPLLVAGDPQRVRQILRNLITNAIRYGAEPISIRVTADEIEASIAVVDSGEGLPAGDEERVFERYFRSEGRELSPGSVGLGLPIARDLARRMGGDLAYRRLDGRTVFLLSLPVHVG